MIYLIGGPPKSGKTTLAKHLFKSPGLPWVSTDTLQNLIKPYIHENDWPLKFPASLMRCQDNDQKYAQYSSDQIIQAYQQQAQTLYEAIDMFVLSEITDSNDFIIEGYHITPELVAQLQSKYPGQIQSIFLIKTDELKFVENIHQSTTPNDWILARSKQPQTFTKIAKMICQFGKIFDRQAQKFNLKVINMDINFDKQLKKARAHLLTA